MDESEYDAGEELLELFDNLIEIDPKMAGERHVELDHLWVFESPSAITRLPRVAIIYTIHEDIGVVALWSLLRL